MAAHVAHVARRRRIGLTSWRMKLDCDGVFGLARRWYCAPWLCSAKCENLSSARDDCKCEHQEVTTKVPRGKGTGHWPLATRLGDTTQYMYMRVPASLSRSFATDRLSPAVAALGTCHRADSLAALLCGPTGLGPTEGERPEQTSLGAFFGSGGGAPLR